ncbi:hypothetical protein ACQ4PT_037704 [Festuca glaucescens]
MWPDYFDYVDRWIGFAIASKAKEIDIDLIDSTDLYENAYHFPLDTLDAQGSSYVESMRLSDGCIKPHPNIRGFTKLTRLVLRFVEIFGDLSDLLLKCPFLNDFHIHNCGVANLRIPHQLDKLQSLKIAGEDVQTVECHGAGLANFEYTGAVIPILLHGCSKLEKASISVREGENTLVHAFTEFPSILAVKILNVFASLWRYNDQVHTLTRRPQGMFIHLRHLTCTIFIFYDDSNSHNGIIQLAHCLDFAPQLETLHLDMDYMRLLDHCWNNGEATGDGCHMHRHDHLKTVYMSGFRCFRTQVALACCILENSAVLEHMTIEPKFKSYTLLTGTPTYLCTGFMNGRNIPQNALVKGSPS